MRKIVTVAGAGAVATVSALVLVPFSASAAGPATTTTAVAGPATVTTGHAVTFSAAVTPFKTAAPVTKAGGTVSFTITGKDNSVVTCLGGSSGLTLNGKGKAACHVAPATLKASASPYTVSAIYTGDANFGGSAGNLSETVVAAKTHVTLNYDLKPTSGSATTFTATVTAGAGSLPTGTVLFSVVSTNGKVTKGLCSVGGPSQPLSPSADAVPVAQATCTLAAGWFKVPAPSTTNPHPVASWTVSAAYSGDGNFGVSFGSKHGSSTV